MILKTRSFPNRWTSAAFHRTCDSAQQQGSKVPGLAETLRVAIASFGDKATGWVHHFRPVIRTVFLLGLFLVLATGSASAAPTPSASTGFGDVWSQAEYLRDVRGGMTLDDGAALADPVAKTRNKPSRKTVRNTGRK